MKAAVYGMGHLGAPLAGVLKSLGNFDKVVGVDPHARKIEEPGYEHGSIHISQAPVASNISFVVVPTPSLEDGSFDTRFVEQAFDDIMSVNEPHSGHLIVLVSTVSPGTCVRLATRLLGGYNFLYSPTFIALGNVVSGLVEPDLLLIGTGQGYGSAWQLRTIWERIFQKTCTISPEVHVAPYTEIELIKLSINAILGTKISMANSLAQVFEAHGVPAKAVQVCGADSRIGKKFLMPGGPIGGPCLPRDNKALRHAAAAHGLELPISAATDVINREVLDTITRWVGWELYALKGERKLGILGLTYKRGTDVTADSLASYVIEHVGKYLGDVEVYGYDPCVSGNALLEEVLACPVILVTDPSWRITVKELDCVVVDPWA